MLTNQIHYKTEIEKEEFLFVCRAGCPTIKAYQAAEEYRTYLYGMLKQQEEAAKLQKEAEESKEEINL